MQKVCHGQIEFKAKGKMVKKQSTLDNKIIQGCPTVQLSFKISLYNGQFKISSPLPMLKWNDLQDGFVLYATLQGGGYDCRNRQLNTAYQDGVWNSVVPYFEWIKPFVEGM